MDSIKKMKRLARVITVLSKYGFDEIVDRSKIVNILPEAIRTKSDRAENIYNQSMYVRIRLVLEELGPTFVKFGQMMSNREDLLPGELLKELEKLQDNVPPGVIDIKQKLESDFGINTEDHFDYLDPEPIASASISQVYKGRLKDGQEVVVKCKRPGIQPQIEADLMLMKDLAELLEARYPGIRRIFLKQVVKSFESNMYRELSLVNEAANMERFQKNFRDDERIYVPELFKSFCNNDILVMEFIEGTKVTDKQKLAEQGLDPVIIADKGLNLYLKQVLDHGFFHADPHPGNIFIKDNGQFVFIDFGSMGSMLPSEKEELENAVLNFILKDAKRLIRSVKKLAVEFDVPDEKELERQVHGLFTLIDENSIENIDVNEVVSRIKGIMEHNRILFPEHMYILVKGVSLLEGIGRRLNPDLNIVASIKPYIQQSMLRRFSPEQLLKKGVHSLRNLTDIAADLPVDLYTILEKLKEDNLTVNHKIAEIEPFRLTLRNAMNRLVYAIIIAALLIGSSILVVADMPPKTGNIPLLGAIGFTLSGLFGLFIIFSIWKKEK